MKGGCKCLVYGQELSYLEYSPRISNSSCMWRAAASVWLVDKNCRILSTVQELLTTAACEGRLQQVSDRLQTASAHDRLQETCKVEGDELLYHADNPRIANYSCTWRAAARIIRLMDFNNSMSKHLIKLPSFYSFLFHSLQRRNRFFFLQSFIFNSLIILS